MNKCELVWYSPNEKMPNPGQKIIVAYQYRGWRNLHWEVGMWFPEGYRDDARHWDEDLHEGEDYDPETHTLKVEGWHVFSVRDDSGAPLLMPQNDGVVAWSVVELPEKSK